MPGAQEVKVSFAKTVILFSVLGPLVISIPLGLMISLGMGNPAGVLLISAGAYVVGFIPALIAGILFYFGSRHLEVTLSSRPRLASMFLGAIAGCVPGGVLGVFIEPRLFIMSLVSGSLCGLVVYPLTKSPSRRADARGWS